MENDYTPRNPNLAQLDAISWEWFDRPFVELDADQRQEVEDALRDGYRPKSI